MANPISGVRNPDHGAFRFQPMFLPKDQELPDSLSVLAHFEPMKIYVRLKPGVEGAEKTNCLATLDKQMQAWAAAGPYLRWSLAPLAN
jgi:hypothetical protein